MATKKPHGIKNIITKSDRSSAKKIISFEDLFCVKKALYFSKKKCRAAQIIQK